MPMCSIRPSPAAKISSVIPTALLIDAKDASAQHPGRTGREVLSLGAMTIGLPRSRVDEMLDKVGLTAEEAGRRVGNYSLGSA